MVECGAHQNTRFELERGTGLWGGWLDGVVEGKGGGGGRGGWIAARLGRAYNPALIEGAF